MLHYNKIKSYKWENKTVICLLKSEKRTIIIQFHIFERIVGSAWIRCLIVLDATSAVGIGFWPTCRSFFRVEIRSAGTGAGRVQRRASGQVSRPLSLSVCQKLRVVNDSEFNWQIKGTGCHGVIHHVRANRIIPEVQMAVYPLLQLTWYLLSAASWFPLLWLRWEKVGGKATIK